jgi:ribonuclease HI
MNFDGSKMHGGLGASVILTSPKGDKLLYVLQIHFRVSNNVAEYEALVHGLKLAKEIGIRRILCFKDSDLVVHQVLGEWDAKDANMASYCFYVQQLCGFFEGCELHHIPRAKNGKADQLSKIDSTSRRFQPECRWK